VLLPNIQLAGFAVLTYHSIEAENNLPMSRRERKYWMRSSRFRHQLDLLAREGFRSMLLSSFWDTPARTGFDRTVIVTIDDGRVSDYETVFPILLESGIHATFFVNTATVGTPGFITWPQAAEMQRHGMSFESHGHDHVYLSALSKTELRRQLRSSKEMIEDRTGTSVRFLAAPYGDTSKLVLPVALDLGYSAVCTSRNWPAQPGSALVNRVVVYGTTTDAEFCLLTNLNAFFYYGRAIRTGLIYAPKAIFVATRKIRDRKLTEVSA